MSHLIPGKKAFGFNADSTAGGAQTSGTAVIINSTNVAALVEDDTDAWYNITNGRFTPQIPGYYLCVASCITGGIAASCAIGIRKNGTTVAQSTNVITAGGSSSPSVSKVVLMNGTTDYIEFWVSSNGDTAWTLSSVRTGAWFMGL